MIDLIGWIGNIGFLLGAILIARKKIAGFYYCGVANMLYIAVGLLLHLHSITVLSIALIFANVYGIYNWRKK